MPVFRKNLPPRVPKKAPLPAVRFASEGAARRAADAGLTAADFANLEPSGKNGYIIADVEHVVSMKGE